MVRVRWCAAVPPVPDRATSGLATEDRERAARLRRREDRAEYVAAHILLRDVLAEEFGAAKVLLGRRACISCGGAHGKPYVTRPATALEFSLSHGGGLAVVAVSRAGPVGVDTERLLQDGAAREIASALHPLEREEIAATHPVARRALVTRLWTRKEAYLKAIGTGLAREPEVDYIGTRRPVLQPHGWELHDLGLTPGSHTAICVPRGAGLPDVTRVLPW